MEIIAVSLTLFTLILIVVLVGTRGRPIILFSQFKLVAARIAEVKGQLILTGTLIFLLAGFVYGFYLMPKSGAGPLQPIAFSHRLHAGDKNIDCRFCHSYVDRSIHPGIPPVEKCLYCHNYIITNHFEIQKEHDYFNSNTPTPWKKVFILPEHVVFNHERHIKKEIQCISCHGDVAATDRLKSHAFKMGFCIACHREKKANLGCWLACHN